MEPAYPLRIHWEGIAVDDPEHGDDLVRRIQEAFEIIWPNRADWNDGVDPIFETAG